MKKLILTATFAIFAMLVNAKGIFPFKEVNSQWNISLNGGYNYSMKVGLYGFGLTIKGFHVTLGGTGSTHKNDEDVGVWSERASCILHAGYQIPITQAFRIIPVVGMAGAGTVKTDGYDWDVSDTGVIHNKTTEDMSYRFDYGAHFVYSYKHLIVNLAISRYTVFGGVGMEF